MNHDYRGALEECYRAGMRHRLLTAAGELPPLSETTLGMLLKDCFPGDDKRMRHVRIAGYVQGYEAAGGQVLDPTPRTTE